MSELPALKVDQTPRHQQHHKQLRHEKQTWLRHRTDGFVRSHQHIEIDDRRIAIQTGRCFYELKSFGQTLHWSLNKVEVINAYHAANRTHVEYRLDPMGKEQRYIVQPRHLSVWEYHPVSSHKLDITPKKEREL